MSFKRTHFRPSVQLLEGRRCLAASALVVGEMTVEPDVGTETSALVAKVQDGDAASDGYAPYDPAFSGGVFVAAGDVNGDASAGGGPHVKVFDGTSPTANTTQDGDDLLIVNNGDGSDFESYPGFMGGVRVATGDITGDGTPDIITGAGAGGGPHVRVFDGAAATQTADNADAFFRELGEV